MQQKAMSTFSSQAQRQKTGDKEEDAEGWEGKDMNLEGKIDNLTTMMTNMMFRSDATNSVVQGVKENMACVQHHTHPLTAPS